MELLEEFKLMQVNKNEVALVGGLEGIISVCRSSLRTKGQAPLPPKPQSTIFFALHPGPGTIRKIFWLKKLPNIEIRLITVITKILN